MVWLTFSIQLLGPAAPWVSGGVYKSGCSAELLCWLLTPRFRARALTRAVVRALGFTDP